MITPSKLYGLMAFVAKHINDNNSKFICVVAKGKDGKFEVFNGETVDVDELQGAAQALLETINVYKSKING